MIEMGCLALDDGAKADNGGIGPAFCPFGRNDGEFKRPWNPDDIDGIGCVIWVDLPTFPREGQLDWPRRAAEYNAILDELGVHFEASASEAAAGTPRTASPQRPRGAQPPNVAVFQAKGDVTQTPGVREAIGRRLTRLGPEANRLLGVAAVIGREVDLAVLTTVAGLADEVIAFRVPRRGEPAGIAAYEAALKAEGKTVGVVTGAQGRFQAGLLQTYLSAFDAHNGWLVANSLAKAKTASVSPTLRNWFSQARFQVWP